MFCAKHIRLVPNLFEEVDGLLNWERLEPGISLEPTPEYGLFSSALIARSSN